MLLLHAPHHHAEVLGFYDDRDALGLQHRFQRVADLLGEAFLGLEPAGEHVDDARDLAEADDVLIRDVAHMHLADEGQEMMLAQAVAFDIGDDDHSIGLTGKKRVVHNRFQIFPVAFCQKLKGVCCPLGGFQKPFAFRVFADGLEKIMEQFFHGSIIKRCP